MKKKKPVLLWAAVGAAAVFLIGVTIGIVLINQKYPPPTIEEHQIGEAFSYAYTPALEITVTDSHFVEEEERQKMLQQERDDLNDPTLDKQYFEVFLTVTNTGSETVQPELYTCVLQSGAWINGTASFSVYENGEETGSLELEPGQKKELKLMYDISSIQFTSSQWEDVKNREYRLMLNLYPIEQSVLLDN